MNKDEQANPVQSEIDSMIKSLSPGSSSPPAAAEPKKEEKKDGGEQPVRVEGIPTGDGSVDVSSGVQKTDKEGDKEADSVVGVVADKKEESKKEEPKLEDKDKIIEDLRAKLAVATTEKPKTEEPKKEEPKTEEPKPPTEQDFIGEIDLDDLTRDPKQLNKILNQVYQKAAEDVRKGILTEIPEAVRTNLSVLQSLQKTTEKFYEENKDLTKFPKVVQIVFDELSKASPDKSLDELMKATGTEVRKRLELPEKAATTEKTKKEDEKPPKLPSKGGRAGRTDMELKSTPVQDEIGEMNKTLGR